jgi:DNA-binding MarR family transcriptional regulator
MIRIAILTILAGNHGVLEKEESLLMAVRMQRSESFTRAEFRAEMDSLEADGLINGVTNNLDKQRRWSITDKGKIALASL